MPPAEKAAHEARVRKEGYPAYRIVPEGERSFYTAILYLEPFSDRNLRAFGYDMHTEPVRRSAMERARDNGDTAISGKVRLVQESGRNEQAGFLMYLPVYRNGMPHATLAERRAHIIGWAYAPFRMNDLMRGIQGEHVNDLAIRIHDGGAALDGALMYDSHRAALNAPPPPPADARETVQALRIAGHPWTVTFRAMPGLYGDIDQQRPRLIAVLGTLTSVLLCWLIRALLHGRQRALAMAAAVTEGLHAADQRFRAAADESPLLIWLAGPDKRCTWVNRRWLEYTGRELNDETGLGWLDGIHGEDLQRYLNDYDAHFERRAPFSLEFRFRSRDGEFRPILCTALPRFDRDGAFSGYVGSCADISDRTT